MVARKIFAEQFHLPNHGDQHPRFDVFALRLNEGQFLRPFDVKPNRFGVYAGARNADVVKQLDGFQFDDARSGQPRRHDVLG